MRGLRIMIVVWIAALTVQAQDAALTEIARFGRGTADALAWRPFGELLAVGGSAGVWLFDGDFALIAHHPLEAGVRFLAWNSDGSSLGVATAAGDILMLGFSADGTEMFTRYRIDGGGFQFAWSPGAGYLLTLQNGVPSIWNAETGLGLRTFADLSLADYAFPVWSADNSQIVAVTQDGAAVVIDAATGEVVAERHNPDEPVVGVLFYGERVFVLPTYSPQNAYLWDFTDDSTEALPLERAGDDFIGLLSLQPNGNLILVRNHYLGSTTNFALLFNAAGSRTVHLERPDKILNLAWTPQGDAITIIGESQRIIHYELTSDTYTTYDFQFTPYAKMLWSPDSRQLVYYPFGSGHFIQLWSEITDEPVLVTFQSELFIRDLIWKPEGDYLLAYTDNMLPHSMLPIFRIEGFPSQGGASSIWYEFTIGGSPATIPDWAWNYLMRWSPDLSRVVYRADDFDVFNVGADLRGDADFSFAASGHVSEIYWQQDGTRFITISQSGQGEDFTHHYEIWDVNAEARVAAFEAIGASSTFSWSADGSRLMILSESGEPLTETLQIYEVSTGELRYETTMRDGLYGAWNADGSRLWLMAGSSQIAAFALTVIDPDGNELFTLDSEHPITPAWNAAGDALAVAHDQRLIVYDTAWDVIAEAETGRLSRLAWSPDGTMIAVVNGDGTLGVWQITP